MGAIDAGGVESKPASFILTVLVSIFSLNQISTRRASALMKTPRRGHVGANRFMRPLSRLTLPLYIPHSPP